jgi:hypothetical protein
MWIDIDPKLRMQLFEERTEFIQNTVSTLHPDAYYAALLSFYTKQAVHRRAGETAQDQQARYFMATFVGEQLLLYVDQQGHVPSLLSYIEDLEVDGLSSLMYKILCRHTASFFS